MSAADETRSTLSQAKGAKVPTNYGAVQTVDDEEQQQPGDPLVVPAGDANAKPTPLDMGQILLLSMARISEPLTFQILFPFVQQMLVDTVIYWARAADRFGRKPVLIASLFGALASTALFGFSRHVWQMYACRFLAGVFGGNAMVIRTLFTENCDSTNQAMAFAYFAFAANMGGLIGPTLGGFFAQPAKQWPHIFGKLQLFVDYPYCLPCLVCAFYVFISMVLCAIWLKETRPDECDNPPPIRSILNRKMLGMLGIFGWTVTVVFSQQALFPLYLFTPVPIGGQGKTPPPDRRIRWIGTKRTFNIVAFSFPFFTVIPVIANAFARDNHWAMSEVMLAIYVSFGSATGMTFTSVQLLLNSCAPPGAIATVNGIAVALCGIVKSIFPAVINSIFAVSVSNQIAKGYLAWFIMVILAAGVFGCSLCVPDDRPRRGSNADIKRRVLEAEGQEAMESGHP
ncbi:hypothetical protein I317_04614 [Kwoniella heveanensis CBS 569]|nr:hypothetical protein I317_04614 [Kwoniella heveanensis CBS 569]